jgi:hypothetical protein
LGIKLAAIALLAAVLAAMTAWMLIRLQPEPLPAPKAPGLRGVRTLDLQAGATSAAEACGITEEHVLAAARAVLGKSRIRVIDKGDSDATLRYFIVGVLAKDECVVGVDWAIETEVLTKKDRREINARIANDGFWVVFPRKNAQKGQALVRADVERHAERLVELWSEVNRKK